MRWGNTFSDLHIVHMSGILSFKESFANAQNDNMACFVSQGKAQTCLLWTAKHP